MYKLLRYWKKKEKSRGHATRNIVRGWCNLESLGHGRTAGKFNTWKRAHEGIGLIVILVKTKVMVS